MGAAAMSNNRLTLTGMAGFREAMRNLPAHLVDEASAIVTSHAESARSKIVASYPHVSGNLKSHVQVDIAVSKGGVVGRVRNTAKHAYIFENGTQIRKTAAGANRGAMPPQHVFVPAAIRAREAMVNQLIAMVRDEGLVVTGG
jgi:hypothetical protein